MYFIYHGNLAYYCW